MTPEFQPTGRPHFGWLALMCSLWALPGCGLAPSDDDDDAPAPDVELACDRDYYPLLKEAVEAAEDRIEVAQWEFFSSSSTNRLIAILNNAVERGVEVRLLLDESLEENHSAVQAFETYGIEAKLDSSTSRKIHTKMVVADGSTAIIGSTNWSWAALDSNAECNLVIRSGEAPAYLDAWFLQLWEDSGPRLAPSVDHGDGLPARAMVNDELLPHLLERIQGAAQSIDFTLYATFLQPNNLSAPAMQVFSSLADAASRGILVRGVADFTDWNPENNDSNQEAVSWLRERGVEMRWDAPDTNMHAKAFLIDQGLQIQTANISTSGLTHNHEGGAWTEDAAVIDAFETWFTELWEASTHIRP